MIAYIDTSALMKRYIIEVGSETIDELIKKARQLIVGPLTQLECISTLRRLLEQKELDGIQYEELKKEVESDFKGLAMIAYGKEVEQKAKELIDKYQLKTLDAIQAGAFFVHDVPLETFICADEKLCKVLEKSGVKVINPLKA